MKRIITISRGFGSGGHSIGQKAAEKLNLNFYDQALLEKIAQETGLSQEYIENSEYAPSRNSLPCRCCVFPLKPSFDMQKYTARR